MRQTIHILHRLALVLALILLGTSCGVAKLARLGNQIELIAVEKIELKGLTGLQIKVEIRNDSQHEVAMNGGVITLFMEGQKVATLTQVSEARSLPSTTQSVTSIWKITDVEPLTLLMLSGRLVQRDFSEMTINYSAELSYGKFSRQISGEGVDITKFISIFAS